MPYSIVILESASNQLAEIYKYIKYNLESPLEAINTIDKIEKAINDFYVYVHYIIYSKRNIDNIID